MNRFKEKDKVWCIALKEDNSCYFAKEGIIREIFISGNNEEFAIIVDEDGNSALLLTKDCYKDKKDAEYICNKGNNILRKLYEYI